MAYGAFPGGDAHGMFSSIKGLPIWLKETERFLAEIGMPTEEVFEIATTPRPPKTDFASIDDVSALPHVDEKRRELYRKFLTMPYPRAFAIASTGNVGWAYEGADPLAAALSNCRKAAQVACALYAIDDEVVWQRNTENK